MEYKKNKGSKRIITGLVSDCYDKVLSDVLVVISVEFYDNCCNKIEKNLGYTTTDEDGKFAFTIDIHGYKNGRFIVKAFNPLTQITT